MGQKTSIVFTWAYSDAAGAPTISAYINGLHCYDVISSAQAENLNLIITKNALWEVNDVTAYEGILTAGQIDYLNTEKTSVLPEPAALAWLTLGVAGVALRRRTAR